MPIIRLRQKEEARYKWGREGKEYFGRGAMEKARKQGQAISISKLRRKGNKIPIRGSNGRRGTIRRRL